MIAEVILSFDNNSKQTISLRKSPEVISYEIEPVITQRITI